jgi:hypothetical protein
MQCIDDAGVCLFRIAELTGLVDFVAPKANLCSRWESVVIHNGFRASALFCFFRLCRVIFFGQPHLGAGLNRKGIGLRPVDLGHVLTPKGLICAPRPSCQKNRALSGFVHSPTNEDAWCQATGRILPIHQAF